MSFRYIGVTDDCVTCQRCGKDELKSTVILAILDADGNPEEITYYGSTCAARALSVRSGRDVLDAARAAHERTLTAASDARAQLAHYGLPETGPADAAALSRASVLYADCHAKAQWAGSVTPAGWLTRVTDMLSRRQAQIADAALLA